MAVNDVFRVALNGGLFGQSIVNIFHYQQTTANTSGLSDVESLAKAFDYVVCTSWMTPLSNQVSYGVVESRTFAPPAVPMTGYDLSISRTGAIDDNANPPTVAVVVRKKTAFLGRKFRGRNYVAGCPVTSVENGQIATGAVDDWNELAAVMAASITWTLSGSPTFVPCIATLDPSVVVAPVGVRVTKVTHTLLDRILRSQRRREIGVGA